MSYSGNFNVVDTVRGLPGYATEMAKGVLSGVIQTQGFLGFIDKCLVILSRVKMLILLGTFIMILSSILFLYSILLYHIQTIGKSTTTSFRLTSIVMSYLKSSH